MKFFTTTAALAALAALSSRSIEVAPTLHLPPVNTVTYLPTTPLIPEITMTILPIPTGTKTTTPSIFTSQPELDNFARDLNVETAKASPDSTVVVTKVITADPVTIFVPGSTVTVVTATETETIRIKPLTTSAWFTFPSGSWVVVTKPIQTSTSHAQDGM